MFNLDFYIHLCVSGSIYLLLRELFNIKVSFILCFLIGIFKEQFLDVYYLLNDFSINDMKGNITGIILAAFLDYSLWTKKQ